jgi:hypothetical protein
MANVARRAVALAVNDLDVAAQRLQDVIAPTPGIELPPGSEHAADAG